jgi:hypothetical protein
MLINDIHGGSKWQLASKVAKNVDFEATHKNFSFGGCKGIPLWKLLDETNPPLGQASGTGYTRLECYSGKVLAATGLFMLGVPRNLLKSRIMDEKCVSHTSTDIVSTWPNPLVYYRSDCTLAEWPEEMCQGWEHPLTDPPFPCLLSTDYGTPHPAHPELIGGLPNTPGNGWALSFEGESPGENFFKIQDDDGRWGYVSVHLPHGPTEGSAGVGDELDKQGRYAIMWLSNASGFQWWSKDVNGTYFDLQSARTLPR